MNKQTVLDSLDIKAFYSSEVPSLRSNGSGMGQGRCPFHEDHKPSLSIDLNTGWFKCFGCDKKGSIFDFYMMKHGVNFKVALEELSRIAGITPQRKLVKTYDYLDDSGKLVFQVLRYDPKGFSQRRPDGKGGWIYNIQGVRLVPYNLPELSKANTVFITEGEKDCDNLKALGLTATCNPHGAGKWRSEFNQYFTGKKVVILPDNDPQGKSHAQTVARNLKGVAESVKVVELPDLPEKGDVSDWLQMGGSKERLLEIVEKTREWDLSHLSHLSNIYMRQMDRSEINPFPFLKKGSDLQILECHIEWIVEKLIPKQGITLLHGRGGIGKTWLSLNLADSISRGIPFMGLNTQKMSVVFVDFENSLPVLVDRVRKIGIEDVLFWHASDEILKPPKLDKETWEQYKALPPNSLLIFDTLRASQSKDENDSQHMAFIMSRLKELRDMGFTILLLHHTPKSNDRTYKGSTAIFDLADHVLSLHRVRKTNPEEIIDDEEDQDCIYRFGTKDKTRYEPFHIFLTFRAEKGFELAKDPDTEDLEAIHQILEEKGRLNGTQLFELVKERLDLRGKGEFTKLMKKGTGLFWNREKEGRAVYYSICPIVSYIYKTDRTDRTDQIQSVQIKKTDTLSDTPQTLENKQLSNCPAISQTDWTDGYIEILELSEVSE